MLSTNFFYLDFSFQISGQIIVEGLDWAILSLFNNTVFNNGLMVVWPLSARPETSLPHGLTPLLQKPWETSIPNLKIIHFFLPDLYFEHSLRTQFLTDRPTKHAKYVPTLLKFFSKSIAQPAFWKLLLKRPRSYLARSALVDVSQ